MRKYQVKDHLSFVFTYLQIFDLIFSYSQRVSECLLTFFRPLWTMSDISIPFRLTGGYVTDIGMHHETVIHTPSSKSKRN